MPKTWKRLVRKDRGGVVEIYHENKLIGRIGRRKKGGGRWEYVLLSLGGTHFHHDESACIEPAKRE